MYSFACGNFNEETVIPDDRTRVSMFSVLGDKLEEQVGKIGKQVEITWLVAETMTGLNFAGGADMKNRKASNNLTERSYNGFWLCCVSVTDGRPGVGITEKQAEIILD